MDTLILNALHGLAGQSSRIDAVGIFLARYLAFILGAIAFIWWARHGRKLFTGFELLSSVFLARGVITEGIRLVVERARPFVANNFEPLIPADPSEFYGSFPSGHATFFFALAATISLYNRRLGNYFFVGATLMGIARIFVGMHWASDIIGGAIIGIISALVAHIIWKWIAVRFERPLS
jgi:undecaprenyl-diphosphatase